MTLQSPGYTCSVVIPSYRYGHLVAHAVESVLWQTHTPEKILVIDDGVGDCRHIPSLYPEVEFIERVENLGVVDNFNCALREITTDRVLFLGADNWLHPEALEELLKYDEEIVYTDGWIWGENQNEYWKLEWQPHGSALYDVSLAKRVGGYEQSGNRHTEEDSILFRKMLDRGARLKRVDRPLFYYRRHRGNFNK